MGRHPVLGPSGLRGCRSTQKVSRWGGLRDSITFPSGLMDVWVMEASKARGEPAN
jgi:hypothetical protein